MAAPLHHTAPTEAQRDTAAAWLMRQDKAALSPSEQAEFLSWLNSDPCHRAAYRDAETLWVRLTPPAQALAARRAKDLEPLVKATRRRQGIRRRLGWSAAALAAILLLAPLLPDLGGLAQNLTADASTGYGETRAVALPDGSTVTLAGNSAIAIHFDDSQRQVSILRGEAFFDVKGGLPQPFTVEAGSAWARVVGTAFNVRRSGKTVQVAVDHGMVDVGGSPDSGSQRLSAGQAAEVTAGQPGPMHDADLAAITAWRSGRMVFYRQDLQDVVARLEEQRPGRIVIANGGMAGRKVSGAFPAGDTDGTLAAIADTLNVRPVRVTPWLTVLY